MPQVDLLLPRVRRLAVLVALVVAALTVVATSAPAEAAGSKVSVRAIQKALGITADGVMGPQTRRALKRFQRRHGLRADGVARRATLKALGLLDAAPSTSSLSGDATTILTQIAQCESGGDPTAVSASGQYRGKYQFSQATWEALGGTGDPAAAAESVQDALAAKLYAERGLTPWPACSAKLSASAG